MARIPDSLRALLAHSIDYAGLYPPAALPLPAVLENYETCLASAESWMLNRLVLPATKLADVRLRDNWRVTLLVDGEPGALPAHVETLESRVPHRLSLPTYCEASIDTIAASAFAEGGFAAKFRCGGVTAEKTPSVDEVAAFVLAAVRAHVPFKATAGLHHPIRSGTMHGFVNVFVAAAFAWRGSERAALVEILDTSDASAFQFAEGELRWRGQSISVTEIEAARRDFAHSFGSCSFAEPLADLRELGWLE